ncbi:MAG: hypothetical protein PF501_13255 [Salinisphaera sp.]|jgi:DNA repair ATPase RecN|nr:hypothetical protein [Salinisphaera sp.]
MSEDSLILEHLKAIQALLKRHDEMFDDVRHRLGSIEQQVAGMRYDFVHYSQKLETQEDRIKRIEQRLELRDDA